MQESIVFSPQTDRRALQQEVDRIDREFSDIGTIEPDVDADTSGIGGQQPGGVGGNGMATGGMAQVGDGIGDGEGVGQQLGAIETGVGGMDNKLNNRLPSSMPGRLSSKVLPVGLAGAASAGLVSQMSAASGHLQTSASVLEIARDNFFREPGRVLDEHIVRPLVNSLFEDSQAFDEMMREGNYTGAAEVAITGNDPREEGAAQRLIGGAGSITGAIGGAKAGAAGGAALGSIIPGAGTAGGALVGGAAGGAAGFFGGGRLTSEIFEGSVNLAEKIPGLSWDNFITAVEWTSWLNPLTWGSYIGELAWDSYLSDHDWGDWTDPVEWVRFVDDLSWTSFVPNLGWASYLNPLSWGSWVPNIDWSDFIPSMGGNGYDGPGSDYVEFARGGVVNKPTNAVVGEAGPEVIAPMSEFRRMMETVEQRASNSGNGGGGMNDSQARDIKRGLDSVVKEIKKLQKNQNVNVSISESDVAQAATQGQSDAVFDTDPMI